MEKHYVCPICGGISNAQKNCDTEGCELHGQPMRECSCDDGKHGIVASEQA